MYNCNSMPNLGKGTLFWNVWFKFRPVGEWERGWIEMDLRWWLILIPVSSVSARATPFFFTSVVQRIGTWADIRIFPPSHLILDHLVEIHSIYWCQESFHSQTGGGDSDIHWFEKRLSFPEGKLQIARNQKKRWNALKAAKFKMNGECTIMGYTYYVSWSPPSCDTIWVCVGRGDLNGTQSRR